MRGMKMAGLIMAAVAASAVAQPKLDRAQMAVDFSKAQTKNLGSLKKYSWKNRMEMREQGGPATVDLNLIRFDSDGKVQKTRIGGTPPPAPKPGLRGRSQRRKIEQRKQMAEKIANLVRSYALPATTGTLVDFFEKAVILQGTGEMKGNFNLQGGKYLKPGDKVTLWLDSLTNMPEKMRFQTNLDNTSVEGEITYSLLKDGTYYPQKTVVKIPDKKLQAVIENFNFTKR